MQTNCTALAKVTINKKLNTFRIVFSFDQHNRITVRNAALVTGDICDVANENANLYITQAIQSAKAVLRTNNIVIVD
jgi:vancomycin permeability regulator SanA